MCVVGSWGWRFTFLFKNNLLWSVWMTLSWGGCEHFLECMWPCAASLEIRECSEDTVWGFTNFNCFFFFFFFCWTSGHVGSKFLDPLQWKHRFLTTVLPGKSLVLIPLNQPLASKTPQWGMFRGRREASSLHPKWGLRMWHHLEASFLPPRWDVPSPWNRLVPTWRHVQTYLLQESVSSHDDII